MTYREGDDSESDGDVVEVVDAAEDTGPVHKPRDKQEGLLKYGALIPDLNVHKVVNADVCLRGREAASGGSCLSTRE